MSHNVIYKNIILKTPRKLPLQVPNQTLAVAIANEWKVESKKKKLDLQRMHLTTLAYTAIDNPFNETNDNIVTSILDYLKFDTIRYRDANQESLFRLESKEWDPVVRWFEEKYNIHVPINNGNLTSKIDLPSDTQSMIERNLKSLDRWPLVAIKYIVSNIKSFILTSALTERHLSVEKVVNLARLETAFQTSRWSKVEWEHDLDEQILRSRISAGSLFYHLSL